MDQYPETGDGSGKEVQKADASERHGDDTTAAGGPR